MFQSSLYKLVVLPVISRSVTETHFKASCVNANQTEQLGVILSWCADTDEGESDSQWLSIYRVTRRHTSKILAIFL